MKQKMNKLIHYSFHAFMHPELALKSTKAAGAQHFWKSGNLFKYPALGKPMFNVLFFK